MQKGKFLSHLTRVIVATEIKEVSITQESCSFTWAGEPERMPSIVPVKIKSKKSDTSVETFAFMDPGSTTTFCTGDLQKRLNVKGKPTLILLSNMGQNKPGEQKLMNSYVFSDLEVCELEDKYIQLSMMYTHSNIPVHTDNLPKQSDGEKWPHLKEEGLPEIEADVGLLIGANCPQTMEPWRTLCCVDCCWLIHEWAHEKRTGRHRE